MNKVSIILPTYNREKSIVQAIESVLAQTYPAFELILVDDGSSDGTQQLTAGIKDDRLRYYRRSVNCGTAGARNEGIRLARYDYIAFQDSDDIWKPDKLEKQMRVFQDNPGIGLVYCAYEGVKTDGTKVVVPDVNIGIDNLQGWMYDRLLLGNTIGGPTAVVRKACLEKCQVNGQFFDESLTCLEDWELFLRIASEYELGFVPEPLLIADIHEGGVSSRVGGYFHARCVMAARHREGLIKYGIFNQVAEQILMMAKQAGVLEQVAMMLEHCLEEMVR